MLSKKKVCAGAAAWKLEYLLWEQGSGWVQNDFRGAWCLLVEISWCALDF
jgi:hypothetical protein